MWSESPLPKETLVLSFWAEPCVMPSDAVPHPRLRSLSHRYHLHNERNSSARKCQMRFQCIEEKVQLEMKLEGLSTQEGGSAGALCGWVTSPALSCCTSLALLSNPLLCTNLRPCWLHLCTNDLVVRDPTAALIFL